MDSSPLYVTILLTHLHVSFSFRVNRAITGDVISGNGIGDYCGPGVTSCSCKAKETFLSELPKACVATVPECQLLVEGSSSSLYTANKSPGAFYVLNIITGSSQAVCEDGMAVTLPVFVRDFQNIMIWNTLWTHDFKERIKAEVVGMKVKLSLRSHWTGLLMKIYINCGNKVQCLAIKFRGEQTYPLTFDAMSSIIGPYFPLPSIVQQSTTAITTTSQINYSKSFFVTSTKNTLTSTLSENVIIKYSTSTRRISTTTSDKSSFPDETTLGEKTSTLTSTNITASFKTSTSSLNEITTTLKSEKTVVTSTLDTKRTTQTANIKISLLTMNREIPTKTSTRTSTTTATKPSLPSTLTSRFSVNKTTMAVTQRAVSFKTFTQHAGTTFARSVHDVTTSRIYGSIIQKTVSSMKPTPLLTARYSKIIVNSSLTYVVRPTTHRLNVVVSSTLIIVPAVAALSSNDDGLSVGWIVLIILLLLILLILLILICWLCLRRKKKRVLIAEGNKHIIENEYPSILQLNQMGSLSSAPAFLNTHQTPDFKASRDNPVFEWDEEIHFDPNIDVADDVIPLTILPKDVTDDSNSPSSSTDKRPLIIHDVLSNVEDNEENKTDVANAKLTNPFLDSPSVSGSETSDVNTIYDIREETNQDGQLDAAGGRQNMPDGQQNVPDDLDIGLNGLIEEPKRAAPLLNNSHKNNRLTNNRQYNKKTIYDSPESISRYIMERGDKLR
ncbi:uncharacterized protein LOC130625291 [Hydractinia symbiolongicarpus]|uniref:uncharacterized protein LOC130625291 n=1 Tax=Hydractinia symbiolongicarpus TaxID=13093 RepID=UPI00254F3FCA|nr:uncharacterized protein LOC130625291 [Hydractinia symbiolongicarpus]